MSRTAEGYTDLIETAVLMEAEKYKEGTFSDHEIVMIQTDAAELCLQITPFNMENNLIIIKFLLDQAY